jgi:hypothetical protein
LLVIWARNATSVQNDSISTETARNRVRMLGIVDRSRAGSRGYQNLDSYSATYRHGAVAL